MSCFRKWEVVAEKRTFSTCVRASTSSRFTLCSSAPSSLTRSCAKADSSNTGGGSGEATLMAIGLFCVRILKAHDEGQADVMYVQYPSSRLVDHGTVSVTSMQLNALMAVRKRPTRRSLSSAVG